MRLLTHPKNVELLRQEADKFKESLGVPSQDVHFIRGLEIHTSVHMEPLIWTGQWKRTQLCNDRFTEWVENHELKNPKSWQIFFGFVEKVMAINYYIIEYGPVVMKAVGNKMMTNIEEKMLEEKAGMFRYGDYVLKPQPFYLLHNCV